jgi:hypothetical protein
MSIRELARRFHHSRRKIREILARPGPKSYQRRPMPSVLDPFKPLIDAILTSDKQVPRKQRHIAWKSSSNRGPLSRRKRTTRG